MVQESESMPSAQFFLFRSISDPTQKDKEDLEEISTELELADEDEKVQYQIGDSFFNVPLSKAQEMLAASTTEIEEEVARMEEEMSELKEEIGLLKAHLYARFGKGINLES